MQNGPGLICCSPLFPGGSFRRSLWDLGLVSLLLGAVLSSAARSSSSPAAQGFPEGVRDAQGERQLSVCGREFSWQGSVGGRWAPRGSPLCGFGQVPSLCSSVEKKKTHRIVLLYIFHELMDKRGLKTVPHMLFLCGHYDFALNKTSIVRETPHIRCPGMGR